MNNLFNLGDLVDRTADPSKLALVDLSRSGEPREYTHQNIDEMAIKINEIAIKNNEIAIKTNDVAIKTMQ